MVVLKVSRALGVPAGDRVEAIRAAAHVVVGHRVRQRRHVVVLVHV